MSSQRQLMIKEKIKDCMREKLQSYNRETDNMPFHYRLLGRDRMALYSFIQSLNTTFGVSIYEPVAIALARERFQVVKTQVKPFNQISTEAQRQIQKSYRRWTLKGMLDLDHEVLIAEELWDFFGGEGSYADLLDAFEMAGIELRDEIDSYFEKFK